MRGKHWRRFLIVLLAAVMGLGLLCGCKSRDVKGNFYTLPEAFENGLLTHEDIETIAYYYNHSRGADKVEYPKKLNKKTVKVIRRAYAKQSKTSSAEVLIKSYFGTYNGCVAIMFDFMASAIVWTETVDGVDFHYGDGNSILVWKAE